MAELKERISDLPSRRADVVGCRRFHAAMLRKLAKKRAEGKSGWNDPYRLSIQRLEKMLLAHVAKGNPVDIANFCMMIWNRRNTK